MKELIEKVVQWGVDRGLDKVGHLPQAKYTLKETAELLDAYADGDIDAMNDAIGDILVTLIVGASNDDKALLKLTEYLCAYNFKEPEYTDIPIFRFRYNQLLDIEFDLLEVCIHEKPHASHYSYVVYALVSCVGSINNQFDSELSIYGALLCAYDEIKSRTGKMINGQFVKDQ